MIRRRKTKAPPEPARKLCTGCHRFAEDLALERDGERLPFCSPACLARWLTKPTEPDERHSAFAGLV